MPMSAAAANTISGWVNGRAQAVRQVLLLRGVGSGEMNHGQLWRRTSDRDPAAMMRAWALNRRVELVYSD